MGVVRKTAALLRLLCFCFCFFLSVSKWNGKNLEAGGFFVSLQCISYFPLVSPLSVNQRSPWHPSVSMFGSFKNFKKKF